MKANANVAKFIMVAFIVVLLIIVLARLFAG
jgi:hypothetical protein